MKIQFFEDRSQKRRIRKEPSRFASVPERLSVYRTGRKGFVDMRAAVSILMPVARELHAAHETMETFPSLTPETIKIVAQKLALDVAAKEYRGVIFPGYSAPEVYAGDTLGIPTDIYAFSAILYFIVTGRAPENAFNRLQTEESLFSDGMYADILGAKSLYVADLKMEEDPFELDVDRGERMPVIPGDLIDRAFVAILEKGMDVEPEKRFSDMAEMIAALAPYDTKASIVYPILMDVGEDEVHPDLIVTKTVRRRLKKEKPRAVIPPEERTRDFDEEGKKRARQEDWMPNWAEKTPQAASEEKPWKTTEERAVSMEVFFADTPDTEKPRRKREQTRVKEKSVPAKEKPPEVEKEAESEMGAAERAAAMEAFFATIPFSEKKEDAGSSKQREKTQRGKRRPRRELSPIEGRKEFDGAKATEIPEGTIAKELLSTSQMEREPPTQEQILQAAAELDESGGFEGVLSKAEKDEVLNFLLEQLAKSKGGGTDFAAFADGLMQGTDGEREKTITIPERQQEEPLGTVREAAMALFSEQPAEDTVQEWRPDGYSRRARRASSAAAASRQPAIKEEAHAAARIDIPGEDTAVDEESVSAVSKGRDAVNPPLAAGDSIETVSLSKPEGTAEPAPVKAIAGQNTATSETFAALLDSVSKQTAELKEKMPNAEAASDAAERQPRVVQLAFDQQHPESVTEHGNTSGKPINLVRLWQKLEQMRDKDDTEN